MGKNDSQASRPAGEGDLRYTVVSTPVGPARVVWSPRGLRALELEEPGRPARAGGRTGGPVQEPSPAGEPAPGPAGGRPCGAARPAPRTASARGGWAAGARRDDSRRPHWQALLDAWFAGKPVPLTLDLEGAGLSPFTRKVLEEVHRIPRGQVRTYGEIARAVGRPGAARAVGNAVAANPIALLIPCHRVVGAGGRLGQYSGGGPGVKERLLRLEGAWPPEGTPGAGRPPRGESGRLAGRGERRREGTGAGGASLLQAPVPAGGRSAG
ncbi:methylated-DNA--[protein]-cysteine S-methyltransferase [Thermaerobacter sp. PB12/4term]|uniref:methylated-DNA--[protein]-cysteine S-methyltransferase n=1 Tax=Thermaerobacter sp. PB12/4term TaxID=2293838 RepID=UPI00193F06F6|nr:MGMT family protein [Thermaerobacter sp. PB12/4term]